MSKPRWMPRSAVALAAAALGTAGLGLAMVPSFAQESKPPTTEQPTPSAPGSDLKTPAPPSDLKTPAPPSDLHEGGDAATASGPGVRGAQGHQTVSRDPQHALSVPATPDAAPGRGTGRRTARRGARARTAAWEPPTPDRSLPCSQPQAPHGSQNAREPPRGQGGGSR